MNNIHVKIHGNEKPYLCDTCGKGFKTTKQLGNHKVFFFPFESSLDNELLKCSFTIKVFWTML